MKVLCLFLFLFMVCEAAAQGVAGKDKLLLYRVDKTRTTTYSDGSQKEIKKIYYDFKLGPEGFYQSLDKNAANLYSIVKIFPDAAKKVDEYNFYRKKNNKLAALNVLSYGAILGGAAMYFTGRRTNSGLAFTGVGVGVIGIAGAIIINNRRDKAISAAQQAVEECVGIYNRQVTK